MAGKDKINKPKAYDDESISSLKGADRVRLRPGVIFGSDGIEGCEHSVFEIVANSIDEARTGHGNEITVTRYLDHSVQVQDRGRGIPLDYNPKEKRFNWDLVYCELYAGGKYDIEDGSYEYSLGLNGLGCCATQYASKYMQVTSFRDGQILKVNFEHGHIVGELQKEVATNTKTGTITRFLPDLEVFTDIDIPESFFHDMMKKQAVVNEKIKLVLKIEKETGGFETFEYFYANGIDDYVKEIAGEDALTSIVSRGTEQKGKDRPDKPEYKVKIKACFTFSNKVNLLEYYHNSSYLEHGGAPEKAVKSASVYAIDALIKRLGKYTKDESKITFQDIQDCLILIINSSSSQTSYENQTKKAINNKFIQEAMTEFLRHELDIYFIENAVDAQKISEQILVNKRSRESAEKARINIKKKLTGGTDFVTRVENFVDCRSNDANRRELYIVEGKSALGSCQLARNSDFQAVIPLRGKILNCLKADYDKIFKNEIIVDLIKVLGCGIEVKSKSNKDLNTFDLSSLRWSKVIICTDADVDGFHIRTLILTMIHQLMPTLLKEGKVYIAESPLYEINTKKQRYFAYSDREKNDVLAKIGDDKFKMQRSKGLGENDPEMMSLTTMDPFTRRLIQVTPTDAVQTEHFFDMLLGDNINARKEYISENGSKYLEMADIS